MAVGRPTTRLLLLSACAASVTLGEGSPGTAQQRQSLHQYALPPSEWDSVVAKAHARAAAVREARLTAYDRTDFDKAANGHRPIPPETSPRSQTWTGKGFQLIAAALSVQFHGQNKSAMKKASDVVMNMTINFQYNGYVPTSENGCVTKALSTYCNGSTPCSTALTALCNSTRSAKPQGSPHSACLQCVGANVGNPALASCSDSDVSRFCSSGRGSKTGQTEAQCTTCANNLKKVEMTCHILHNPVMQLPIYSCDGCNPAAVEGYCSTVGSGHAPVTHDHCFQTLSANPKQCSFGMPLEQSHLVRAFSMFDSGSRWVKELGKTPWSQASQEKQRAFWFARAQVEQRLYPGDAHRLVWAMYGSENIDACNQISVYLAIDALCQHKEYATKIMPDGKPLSESLKAWEQWAYDWLKARATGGLFVELGADYWGRTWPNIMNLLDLPSSARVRQRAKMFIDIAQVEAEQAAVNGVRTGQKSRAKNDALTECMYNSLMPDLYGEAVNASPHNAASWRGNMGEMTASSVTASNVSILAHLLGKAPETEGQYIFQNRIIGQVNATQVTTCAPSRCAGTLRPTGCICTHGAEAGKGSNGAYFMESKSDQVHTVWQTPSYGMGAVVFSPNDYFSPNTQQRWVGLIFSDENHTAFGFPHLTGEKYSLVDEDIMIMQRCGSCNYGGDSLVHMYNTTLDQIKQQCGWYMITVRDIGGREAYAAVRSAYGDSNLTSTCSGDSCKNNPTQLKPLDTWAPILLLTGRATDYGSFANFSAAVCGTKLDVDTAHQGGHVALSWKGHAYHFTTNNRTGRYVLPTKDGKSVSVSPPWQYKGPHLNAGLHPDTVTLSYTEHYVLDYQFIDGADAIVRKSDPSHQLKADDYDAIVAAAHQRAALNRRTRVASWDVYDFTPAPQCGECTAEFCQNWTICGFRGVAAAIGSMFSGQNSSAMTQSNQFIVNMTENFKQNGFVPAPTTNCSVAIQELCGGARHGTPHSSAAVCEACAGSHLHELNVAKCTGRDVSTFCGGTPGPPPTRLSCFNQCLHRNGSAVSFGDCIWHMPLERSHLVRAFALFDGSSRFVKGNGGNLHAWGAAAQQALRDFFIAQTQANLFVQNESVYLSNVRNMFASENIDSSQQVTTYLALDVLNNIDGSLKFADGDSVQQHLTRWEQYMYAWIKHKATSGLFSELGSTGYWSRTWPNVFNLADLPTSERVRQRAKMYIDIAMVEAEQASITGVRAGQKSRAKKGGFGHGEGIAHSFYVSVAPQLYGESLSHWPKNNTLLPPSNRIIENEAGFYVGSNVSILMHLLGKSPNTSGSYMMRNRMIGQVDQSDTIACSDERCAETLRPSGCICTKGADDGTSAHYTMLAKSDQLHSIWHTPSYALGGVEFSPNDFFSPNSQQRWTGLVFGNVEHTAIGLPHLTGEKWQLVDEDVMISQKCADCNYGGDSILDLYNLTSKAALTQPCGGNWTVISIIDLQGKQAWAAAASGWGGATLLPPRNLSAAPINFQLIPGDTWAPIVILTGQEAQYGTLANFTSAVCATNLLRGHKPFSWGGNDLDFRWNGRSYCWHANIPDPMTNTTRSPYQAPSDNGDHGRGRNISAAPSYSGPHLNAALLSDTVTLSYTAQYVLEYRFVDDEDGIVRIGVDDI